MPGQSYRLVITITDPKSYETRSLMKQVTVYPGATTLVVLSFYIPSEKERMRSKQTAQINIFQLWGKGTEIFPEKR
jgi:myo-inositol catabolism protein IolC